MARKRTGTPAESAAPEKPDTSPPAADGKTDVAPFPIVVLGASAGGLPAFRGVLEAIAADTGMAFVLVPHLDPDHQSLMAEILGRACVLPVSNAEHRTRVEPNHVYVMPPGTDMTYSHARLVLSPRTEKRGQHRPIDRFMRSLAEEHGPRAIGVVLSGTGTDGTLGLQEIKTAGGITIAQDASAEHRGMPESAAHSGFVDLVLAPADIARELERISRHAFLHALSTFEPGGPGAEDGALIPDVLELVRAATGVDFGHYKRSTIGRRVARRIVLNRMDSLAQYLGLLRESPQEVENLHQDFLINVTSFFRNPEAYEALKARVFPRLVAGKTRHEPVRMWTLGCSTGEEAYSLAMAYQEFADETGTRVPLQVFATDIDATAVERARTGLFPAGIAQDVPAERLRRFFIETERGYRIAKSIRDLCVFARQNVLADPPFSRMDLIACRNVLIYLEPVLQQKLMPLLHYALRPGGFLWLGTSETIGTFRDLFEVEDSKNKIFARKPGGRTPAIPVPSRQPVRMGGESAAERPVPDPHREADRILLTRYAPPSVLLDNDLDILQFRGETSPYLAPAAGKASLSLLKMLREGLLVGVRGALHRARREHVAVREDGLRVRTDKGYRTVNVGVIPVRNGEGSLLVVFEDAGERSGDRARKGEKKERADAARALADGNGSDPDELKRVRQELDATRDYLQSVIEQQEAANEELQSANEEVQSANEELQSINEELETSKEEIQSSNEELATVNDELERRANDLARSNDDLANLIASVQLPIVMVGADLRIRRFTPSAEKLLNLIPSDIGRSVTDIRLNLDVPDLETIVNAVMGQGGAFERAVLDRDGRWHSLRVRQYRTGENRVDGAVILLVDIDSARRTRDALREAEERFARMADTSPVLFWVIGPGGVEFVNRAYEEFFGTDLAKLRAADWTELVHPEDRGIYVAAHRKAAEQGKPFTAIARVRRRDGTYRWIKSIGAPRGFGGLVGTSIDVTDLKEAEGAKSES